MLIGIGCGGAKIEGVAVMTRGHDARHCGCDLKAAPAIAPIGQGDRLAGLLWVRNIERPARGLAIVVSTLDPEVLLMGGACPTSTSFTPTCPPPLPNAFFHRLSHPPQTQQPRRHLRRAWRRLAVEMPP